MDADGQRGAGGDKATGDGGPGALESAPGLARIAAGAWLRTARWTAGSAIRASRRIADAAVGRESASALVGDAQAELVGAAQRLLGMTDPQQSPGSVSSSEAEAAESDSESLKQRGYELLERSSELTEQREAHPAYVRILEQLAPDEARILRLLATEGPQPAVDIRTWRPLDLGSTVVAPGLSMIAQHAGCRHPERLPAHLSNLYRLGLIRFSRERLPDPGPYQLLEAQPDVIDAVRATGRARIVRRSIYLTPFGGHFCQQCLPLETTEIDALAGSG